MTGTISLISKELKAECVRAVVWVASFLGHLGFWLLIDHDASLPCSWAGGLEYSWIPTYSALTLSKFSCRIWDNNSSMWVQGALLKFRCCLSVMGCRFFWIRAGMMGWLLINLSVAAKQFIEQGSLSLSMALCQVFCTVWYHFPRSQWYLCRSIHFKFDQMFSVHADLCDWLFLARGVHDINVSVSFVNFM